MICNAEFTDVLPGVTDAGEKLHEDAPGKPEQLNETGEPKLGAGRRMGSGPPAARPCSLCYLGLMVTVNELFAGFVSVPLKVATPVAAMEPACVTVTFMVTVIVEPGFNAERLQVTVPPAVPGAGVEQVPSDVLADANCRLGGKLLLKTSAFATVCWLFLICQVYVSADPTAGPPFCADPVT